MKDQSSTPESASDGRRKIFRLAALLLGLIPFVALEAGLRIAGIGRPDQIDDPFVGFSDIQPLFVHGESRGERVTARSRQRFFGPQTFAATKPEDTFRAFVLGGSTVRGRPYTVDTAFPKWAELELNACDESTTYEFINCGGLSYASYRLRPILREVLEYDPDLIVLATGHNEFLEERTYSAVKERSPIVRWLGDRAVSLHTVNAARSIFRSEANETGEKTGDGRTVLAAEVDAQLDYESGYASYHYDEEWQADVIDHFDLALRQMISMCEQADVPVVFVRLGSCLRDCPPFKSEHHPENFSPDEERVWRELFDRATELEDHDVAAAADLYQQAANLSDEYALGHYRLARCFDRMGDFDAAAKHYGRASERDVCPLRMLEPEAKLIDHLSKEHDLPLIAASDLSRRAGHESLPGYDVFLDHVHPSIGLHQRIGAAIVEILLESEFATGRPLTDLERRVQYREHLREIGGMRFLKDADRRLGWLENWSRRQRLYNESLPYDPASFIRHGVRKINLANRSDGFAAFDSAFSLDEELAWERLLTTAFGFYTEGRTDDARSLLDYLRAKQADAVSPELLFASLIVAVDANDTSEAKRLITRIGDQLSTARTAGDEWAKLLPDFDSRVEELVPQ